MTIYILTVLFFSTSIALAILFYKKNIKYTKLKIVFDKLKNDILNSNRIGYYSDSVTLLTLTDREAGKSGDKYYVDVHIKEIDRYTNGKSKIELIKIEVTGGYDSFQYNGVKEITSNKFKSVKNTVDIEWLESEESLKKQRKDKLKEVLKNI